MAAAGDLVENTIINAGDGSGGDATGEDPTIVEYCEPNEDCPVCLENFEEENLDVVTCGCGYMVCRGCTQNYLLHTTKDPHCMKCKRRWDKDFQFNMLTPSFVNNKYKSHRKKLLFEREKARLPDAQPYVEQYKNKNLYDAQLKELSAQIDQQRQIINALLVQRNKIYENVRIIESGGFVKPKEKRQFIRKCPTDGCRGFLSTAYKCDLCKVFVCSKCLEPKGVTKDAEHTCIQSNVESANAIKKETRPCPRCAVPIFKVSGCDQMWCTQCQVAFSWKSGKVDTGRVHNPHFYQFMKNNEGVIRNPGEQVCGGLPGYYTIGQIFHKIICNTVNPLYRDTMNIYRGLIHIQRVLIDPIRERLNRNQDNLDLRVRYLVKEVDEKYVMRYVAQRDNVRSKNTAMLQVFELFNVIVTEQLNSIFTTEYRVKLHHGVSVEEKESFKEKVAKMIEVVSDAGKYCNKQLEKISKNYNMKVHIIESDFSVKNTMYKFT